MDFKLCAVILFFGCFQIISGQRPSISCTYSTKNSIYVCDLSITNPGGADTIANFGGNHQSGKFDANVDEIDGKTGSVTTNIPSVICTRFINLQTIKYVEMGIETIGEKSFKFCHSVSSIYLKSNAISDIHELAFSENPELQKLDLSQNQISTLPGGIFESLTSLTLLDLSSNQIEELSPEWFTNLESLQKLYLTSNKISELPSQVFAPISTLLSLNLGYNGLTTIDSESFGDLSQLKLIDFTHNSIQAVDEKFIDKAASLTSLMMTNNECVDDNFINSDNKEGLEECFSNFENGIAFDTTTTDETTTGTDSTTEESTSDSTEISTTDTTDETTTDSACVTMFGKVFIISIILMNIVLK